MSFIITVYVPGAIVMAADSRQSIRLTRRESEEDKNIRAVETVNSDFVYKVFSLPKHDTGISVCGEFVLNKVTVESHIKRFQEEKLKNNDTVHGIAQKVHDFFLNQFPSANTTFHIAGFNKVSGISIPYVYLYQNIKKELRRLNVNPETEEITYGTSWGGQGDVIANILGAKLLKGPDNTIKQSMMTPIIWDSMPIQDAIDFAIYAVRTSIDTIRFQARPKNVGGPIDVLLLTPEKSTWLQRKEYRGQLP